MSEKIRIGLIGCGVMGKQHSGYIITDENTEVAAMADPFLWKPDGTKSWFEPLICEKQPVKYQLPYALQLQHFCDVIKGKAVTVTNA